MKAILVLALLVLVSNAQLTEVTELYRSFVANLATNERTKNDLTNSGLECLTTGGALAINLIEKIQTSVEQNDYVSIMRTLLNFGKIMHQKVVPVCQDTAMKFMMFAAMNARTPQIDIQDKELAQDLFEAKLVQLSGNVLTALLAGDASAAGKELAVVASAALGLTKVELPKPLIFDYSKIVPIDIDKLIPEFIAGFLPGFGITDQTVIKGFVGCANDISMSIQKAMMNIYLNEADFFNSANAMLDSFDSMNAAVERCTTVHNIQLDKIMDFTTSFWTEKPFEAFSALVLNYIKELPEIFNDYNSFEVYLHQGQYELAGKQYAMYLLRTSSSSIWKHLY